MIHVSHLRITIYIYRAQEHCTFSAALPSYDLSLWFAREPLKRSCASPAINSCVLRESRRKAPPCPSSSSGVSELSHATRLLSAHDPDSDEEKTRCSSVRNQPSKDHGWDGWAVPRPEKTIRNYVNISKPVWNRGQVQRLAHGWPVYQSRSGTAARPKNWRTASPLYRGHGRHLTVPTSLNSSKEPRKVLSAVDTSVIYNDQHEMIALEKRPCPGDWDTAGQYTEATTSLYQHCSALQKNRAKCCQSLIYPLYVMTKTR